MLGRLFYQTVQQVAQITNDWHAIAVADNMSTAQAQQRQMTLLHVRLVLHVLT